MPLAFVVGVVVAFGTVGRASAEGKALVLSAAIAEGLNLEALAFLVAVVGLGVASVAWRKNASKTAN